MVVSYRQFLCLSYFLLIFTLEYDLCVVMEPFTCVCTCHMYVHVGCTELDSQECELVRRLNSQFPGDIGCFCVFFLNFVQLQPGEALYLAPNEPHAYIWGGEKADASVFVLEDIPFQFLVSLCLSIHVIDFNEMRGNDAHLTHEIC